MADKPATPDRLDLAISESQRLMDETKRLIEQTPSNASAVTEEDGHQAGAPSPLSGKAP